MGVIEKVGMRFAKELHKDIEKLPTAKKMMVTWFLSVLFLRGLADNPFEFGSMLQSLLGHVPLLGQWLLHGFNFFHPLISNFSSAVLFVLCIPRGGVKFMCTEYKSKQLPERMCYAGCVLLQAYFKPSGSWVLDLLRLWLQGALLIENEESLKDDGDGEVHHVLAVFIMLFASADCAWRIVHACSTLSPLGTFLAVVVLVVVNMFGAKAVMENEESMFQVWQRVFIVFTNVTMMLT